MRWRTNISPVDIIICHEVSSLHPLRAFFFQRESKSDSIRRHSLIDSKLFIAFKSVRHHYYLHRHFFPPSHFIDIQTNVTTTNFPREEENDEYSKIIRATFNYVNRNRMLSMNFSERQSDQKDLCSWFLVHQRLRWEKIKENVRQIVVFIHSTADLIRKSPLSVLYRRVWQMIIRLFSNCSLSFCCSNVDATAQQCSSK